MYKQYPTFYNYEVLEYDRKSRFDDPYLSVEEVLEKHARMIEDYSNRYLSGPIPIENKYKEIGSGETIDDRPEMLRLLKAIEDPKIKAVIVVDVQRLSRGDLEDAGRLIKLLRYTDTYVITPNKIYDLRDEFDRDAFERELKRGSEYLDYFKKISLRGKLDSVKEGNYIASRAPFGFDRVQMQDGNRTYFTLKENKEEADIVRMVFNWFVNDGLTTTRICRNLESMNIKTNFGRKKWHPNTVVYLLENHHYIGCVRWNWRKTVKIIQDQELKKTRPQSKVGEYLIYNGKHDGIIPEELFNRANSILGTQPKIPTDKTLKNMFSGIMVCKKCGYGIGYKSFISGDKEYARPVLRCNNQVRCKSGCVDFEEARDRIINMMEEIIEDFKVRIENKQDDSIKLHKNLVATLEKRLKDLETKEKLQWDAKHHPDPDERIPSHIFKELNAKVLKEKAEVNEALDKARGSMPEIIDYKELYLKFTDALEILKDPDVSATIKNRYLKDIISKITFYRPPTVKLTNANKAKYGIDKITADVRFHQEPYEINIKIK